MLKFFQEKDTFVVSRSNSNFKYLTYQFLFHETSFLHPSSEKWLLNLNKLDCNCSLNQLFLSFFFTLMISTKTNSPSSKSRWDNCVIESYYWGWHIIILQHYSNTNLQRIKSLGENWTHDLSFIILGSNKAAFSTTLHTLVETAVLPLINCSDQMVFLYHQEETKTNANPSSEKSQKHKTNTFHEH